MTKQLKDKDFERLLSKINEQLDVMVKTPVCGTIIWTFNEFSIFFGDYNQDVTEKKDVRKTLFRLSNNQTMAVKKVIREYLDKPLDKKRNKFLDYLRK